MPNQIELLNKVIVDQRRGLPLHLQVQRALRTMIDEHFEDGEAFFTESMLVEHLKVSRATVRQALGELTRDGVIVRRVAKGTVVTKKSGAGAAASRDSVQTGVLGVFIAQYDSDHLSDILEQLAIATRKRGLSLQVYHTHRGEQVSQAYSEVRNPPDVERILLVTPVGQAELNEALVDRGYRTVAIERSPNYPGVFVETDSAMAVRIGLEHLKSLGHRRIALLVNEPATVSSVAEKVEAFRRSIAGDEIDARSRIVICGTEIWQSSYDAAYAHMDEVWGDDALERPTAIFAVSDPGAWAAMKWLAERNVNVPGDASVLGFEGARLSQFTHPALSTVAHPIAELVQTAIDAVWSDEPQSVKLAPRLIVRDSTGPAPPKG